MYLRISSSIILLSSNQPYYKKLVLRKSTSPYSNNHYSCNLVFLLLASVGAKCWHRCWLWVEMSILCCDFFPQQMQYEELRQNPREALHHYLITEPLCPAAVNLVYLTNTSSTLVSLRHLLHPSSEKCGLRRWKSFLLVSAALDEGLKRWRKLSIPFPIWLNPSSLKPIWSFKMQGFDGSPEENSSWRSPSLRNLGVVAFCKNSCGDFRLTGRFCSKRFPLNLTWWGQACIPHVESYLAYTLSARSQSGTARYQDRSAV